jgi:hypothetical protein
MKEHLDKIRKAVDGMYDVLNVTLYKKSGGNTNKDAVNPSVLVTPYLQDIANKLRQLEEMGNE